MPISTGRIQNRGNVILNLLDHLHDLHYVCLEFLSFLTIGEKKMINDILLH